MGILGWALGGASGLGPSSVYDLLPFKGWKETSQWLEEAVDSIGLELDFRNLKFFKAQARANLLDPTYTPGMQDQADANIANATTAPTNAVSRDTMLDILLYVALGYFPADTNLSIAQKQAIAQIGWAALRRKGTRLQLLNLASKLTDGVAIGWTVPPFNFSIVLPDGTPSPGYGPWVQAASGVNEVQRPWVFAAVRALLGRGMAPDWAQLGVGGTVFRAGYSGAGETVFPVGSRVNILAHEHFDAWAAGAPTGWTKIGTGTLTQSTSAPQINWEFTGNAAVLDLTGLGDGTSIGLQQFCANVNNQIAHRLQFDYAYANSQNVSTLQVQVTDANIDGNTYYWTGSAWTIVPTSLLVPPAVSRSRFAADITMQANSQTATTRGTLGITVAIFAKSDGTATTQTTYTIYRAGLYEKFDLGIEQAALGERTLWQPLVDAPGWSAVSRTGGGTMIEPANSDRSSVKLHGSGEATFPYHPAISARGFRSHSSWTNLVKGSNNFGVDWSLVSATKTDNSQFSPTIGASAPLAPLLAATGATPALQQGFAITPASKSYVGGVWVKKISADNNFTDVTLTIGATTIFSQSFTVTQAQGWVLLPIQVNFGAGEVNSMVFKVSWGAASSTGQISVADAYLYDVTGKSGVLYPPVVRTAVGATASTTATTVLVTTAGANVLHPLTQRTLASVIRGSLGLVIVPTFGASSQPSQVIFDVAQGAAQNRVALRVQAGLLDLRRWDNAGNQWAASIPLSQLRSPPVGSMTWIRDQPIIIRCLWDENSTMLAAGNGAAIGTKPGSWAPSDASVAAIGIGNDFASANQFDGMATLLEVIQLGAPAT